MKRAILILLCLVVPATAHIGSPDVFFEGDAGPYKLFVTVRMPSVIPGVAEIGVRARDTDVTGMTVVPMRLTGPGSELPPTPDRASRDSSDKQMFTAELWLMEHGALQVKISVEGARGPATLAVPIRSAAQKTLKMDRKLGSILFGLMVLLALAFVSIAAAAVREGALDPGVLPSASSRKRTRIAALAASALVLVALAFGNWWWTQEAKAYESMVDRPWALKPTITNCSFEMTHPPLDLLPDHGHDMHLFVLRVPQMDRLAHLHPVTSSGAFRQQLPSLPAGKYKLFADIVLSDGYPITGMGEIEIADITCGDLQGDDSQWSASQPTGISFEAPPVIRAREPVMLKFRATDVEPYMGMAGHAAIVKTDLSVFAHLHPSGSVAMPSLMLAGTNTMTHAPHLPDDVSFPYGFPSAGTYKVFVQIKRAGRIDTAGFDVTVQP